MSDHEVVFRVKEEGAGWVASCDQFPDIHAAGDSILSALNEYADLLVDYAIERALDASAVSDG